MFTLVACLVVVGVSAAAVLWQTRGGVHQPATEPPSPHVQSGLGHAARAAFSAGAPGPGATGSEPSPPVAKRGIWARLGAAGKLVVLVVVIGTGLAATLGAVAAFAAFALREAVK